MHFSVIEKAYAVKVGVNFPGSSTSDYTYTTYVSALLKFALAIGFSLSVLMIVYAGIKYMLSQGNQTQVNDAKEILTSAITGLAVLLLIALILKTLGVSITF